MSANLEAKAGIIFSCIGTISVFLPWAKIPIINTVAGIYSIEGKIALGMFIILCVSFAFFSNNKNKPLIVIGSILPLLCALYYSVDFSSILKAVDSANSLQVFGISVGGIFNDSDFSLDWGLDVSVIAAVGCLISSFYAGRKEVSENDV